MSNEPKKPRTRQSSACQTLRQTLAAELEPLKAQNTRLPQELIERQRRAAQLMKSPG